MNINTDSILFLFLFIFPGAFSKVLYNRFCPKSNKIQKTHYTELSEILVSSVVILLLNMITIVCLNRFGKVPTTVIGTLIGYILITLINTALFSFVFYFLNKYAILFMINKYNKWSGKAEEAPNQTVWETVFESKKYVDIPNNPIVVAIEKDGTLISRGLIAEYPAPQTDCNDIVLQHCSAIEKIFTEDARKPEDEKIFNMIDLEYCDFEKGVTIKFYNMEAYKTKCI